MIWIKIFDNGPCEVCGRQPLKNLKWYGLLKHSLLTYSRLIILLITLRKTKQISKKITMVHIRTQLSQLQVTSRNSPLPNLHLRYNPLLFHKCCRPGHRQQLTNSLIIFKKTLIQEHHLFLNKVTCKNNLSSTEINAWLNLNWFRKTIVAHTNTVKIMFWGTHHPQLLIQFSEVFTFNILKIQDFSKSSFHCKTLKPTCYSTVILTSTTSNPLICQIIKNVHREYLILEWTITC